jgi:hypothetical protein
LAYEILGETVVKSPFNGQFLLVKFQPTFRVIFDGQIPTKIALKPPVLAP